MHPFPHQYRVDVAGGPDGVLTMSAEGLPSITAAPPVQFGGPGTHWSPETLLVAAAVTCLALTFAAIAQASKLNWTRLSCSGEGVLDRVEGVTRFTELHLHAQLELPHGADEAKATRLLEKAERSCLVTNSLSLTPTLTCDVKTV